MVYILSLYMLLLAVFPCCLVDDCPDDKVEKVAHQNGDDDCGNCSPFFSCEGCAFASAIADPVYYSVAIIPVKPPYMGFIPAFVADVHYDFWQPPKLG